jgi:uncharacterized membrane protein YhhN
MIMENKKFDVLYIAMVLTIVGQITVGNAFYFGQGAFLLANIIYTSRDFYLKRPVADKVKNICFTAITIGVIILQIIMNRG